MPYREEHTPWQLGSVVFEYSRLIQFRGGGETRHVMVPRNVAVSSVVADDILLGLFVTTSPNTDKETLESAGDGSLGNCYKSVLRSSKQIVEYMDRLDEVGQAINRTIAKKRRKVD